MRYLVAKPVRLVFSCVRLIYNFVNQSCDISKDSGRFYPTLTFGDEDLYCDTSAFPSR